MVELAGEGDTIKEFDFSASFLHLESGQGGGGGEGGEGGGGEDIAVVYLWQICRWRRSSSLSPSLSAPEVRSGLGIGNWIFGTWSGSVVL